MASFRWSQTVVGVLVAATGAIALDACGASANSDMMSAPGEGGAQGGGGAGPTSGSGAGDASLDIGADGAPTPDPTKPFAALCGDPAKSSCAAGTADSACNINNNMGGGVPQETDWCKLTPSDGVVIAQCSTSGASGAGEPCTSALTCSAALGCVAAPNAIAPQTGGLCREYCCGDVEACPKGTYCAAQPMAEATNLEIPACIPATACVLLDDSTCPAGQTCTIVRADGTTSCVVPQGSGIVGDSCPCAAGYLCAKLTNECKKLCHIGHPEECNGAPCQGGSMSFPDGFGLCASY